MSSVIKKKKKSLLSRVIGRIKGDSFPHGQEDVASDVPLDDVRINDEDITAIDLRRNELRAMDHDNTDAVVTFDGNG